MTRVAKLEAISMIIIRGYGKFSIAELSREILEIVEAEDQN